MSCEVRGAYTALSSFLATVSEVKVDDMVLFHVVTRVSHSFDTGYLSPRKKQLRGMLSNGNCGNRFDSTGSRSRYIYTSARNTPPSFPVFFVFLVLTHLPLRKRLVCHLLRLVDLGGVSLGTQRVGQLVCGLGLEVCAVVLVGLSAQTQNISFPVP